MGQPPFKLERPEFLLTRLRFHSTQAQDCFAWEKTLLLVGFSFTEGGIHPLQRAASDQGVHRMRTSLPPEGDKTWRAFC